MQTMIVTAALIAVTALDGFAQVRNDCRHEAQRSSTVAAGGARLLSVQAGAGSLRIEGKPGLDHVVIRGRACASDGDLLEQIQLRANRDGSTVVVIANKRDGGWSFRSNQYARLDVVIQVPAGMAAEIADGSGSIDIVDLGAVRITDGSGDILGNRLGGDVHIKDGSGGIRLVDVAGRVEIEDGSGGISLRNIGSAIDVDDSSGDVNIRGARSSVRISDSSGSIDVADVAGDFIVADDGSGSIDYVNVRGRVDIPRRRR